MTWFWDAKIDELVVHHIGNKAIEEGVILSDDCVDGTELSQLANTLLNFFLKPLKESLVSHLSHPVSNEMNEVFNIASAIFAKKRGIVDASKDIARVLYSLSSHPKIKSGELYVAYLTNCEYDGRKCNALGLFKSELTEEFLRVEHDGPKVKIQIQDGINVNNLDKGCVILNVEREKGYIVYNLDNSNRSSEAVYWKDSFLNLRPANDNFHFTKNVLSIAKEFITSSLVEELQIEKANQIDLLNRSMTYFKDRDTFDIKEFEDSVFQESNIIDSFRRFGSHYITENDIDIADTFEISSSAVKKQAKVFKRVINLDSNFQLHIKVSTDLIEKGFDNRKGKHYYKIYFDRES